MLGFVHTFSVEDRIESDHMPVELYCNFYTDQNAHIGEKIQGKKENIFWCEEKVQDFKDYVTSVEFRDHVERATGMMDDCINASIEIFTQALLTAAGCMLKTVKVRTGTQNRSSWFDAECHKKKKGVRKCLRRFRNSRDSHDLVIYQSQRKEYKCLLQKKKREEQNSRVDSLVDTLNNSKEFW